MRKLISLFILSAFLMNCLVPPSFAQLLNLPAPGSMVGVSPAFMPTLIKGLKVHPENPLLFDFIVDAGKSGLKTDSAAFKTESEKLIKYFLTSLTIKEDDLWVNLSPYEHDRMITEDLGKTELGRDMLAQDYILKQLSASMIHPDKDLGKAFWARVYAKAQEQFGNVDIPVDTFNKVWIVADKAKVLERNNTAFVVDAHLKVMLESDYNAQEQAQTNGGHSAPLQNNQRGSVSSSTLPSALALDTKATEGADRSPNAQTQELTKQVIREIILPEIEKEVNQGKNFAPLRQILYSMILSTWFQTSLKEAFLNQIYSNKVKTEGVLADDPMVKEKIYAQYLEAYKKGVFNLIKDDVGARHGVPEMAPRKYFSGGIPSKFGMTSGAFETVKDVADRSMMAMDNAALVTTNLSRSGKVDHAGGVFKGVVLGVLKKFSPDWLASNFEKLTPVTLQEMYDRSFSTTGPPFYLRSGIKDDSLEKLITYLSSFSVRRSDLNTLYKALDLINELERYLKQKVENGLASEHSARERLRNVTDVRERLKLAYISLSPLHARRQMDKFLPRVEKARIDLKKTLTKKRVDAAQALVPLNLTLIKKMPEGDGTRFFLSDGYVLEVGKFLGTNRPVVANVYKDGVLVKPSYTFEDGLPEELKILALRGEEIWQKILSLVFEGLFFQDDYTEFHWRGLSVGVRQEIKNFMSSHKLSKLFISSRVSARQINNVILTGRLKDLKNTRDLTIGFSDVTKRLHIVPGSDVDRAMDVPNPNKLSLEWVGDEDVLLTVYELSDGYTLRVFWGEDEGLPAVVQLFLDGMPVASHTFKDGLPELYQYDPAHPDDAWRGIIWLMYKSTPQFEDSYSSRVWQALDANTKRQIEVFFKKYRFSVLSINQGVSKDQVAGFVVLGGLRKKAAGQVLTASVTEDALEFFPLGWELDSNKQRPLSSLRRAQHPVTVVDVNIPGNLELVKYLNGLNWDTYFLTKNFRLEVFRAGHEVAVTADLYFKDALVGS
ncbi:MAG: hypothetical protein V2A70_03645, partial [Candidatus Omnitrophota bacterium]